MNPLDEDSELREVERLNAEYQGALMAAALLENTLARTPWWHPITRLRLILRIGEAEDTASLARQEIEIIASGWEQS